VERWQGSAIGLAGGLGVTPNEQIFGENRKRICICPACHY